MSCVLKEEYQSSCELSTRLDSEGFTPLVHKSALMSRCESEVECGGRRGKTCEWGDAWRDEDDRCLLNVWSSEHPGLLRENTQNQLQCFKCLLLYSRATIHKGHRHADVSWCWSAAYQSSVQDESSGRPADGKMSSNSSLKVKPGLRSDRRQHCVKRMHNCGWRSRRSWLPRLLQKKKHSCR